MTILTGVCYDPTTAAAISLAAASAMTAFDTTNLRLTFTAPTSGLVKVVIGTVITGVQGSPPQVLFGVLSGTTVVRRKAPAPNGLGNPTTTSIIPVEASFIVDGLTSGGSYTWDAAYGIELGATGTLFRYGGPNDTTASNAFGGISYEIWQVT